MAFAVEWTLQGNFSVLTGDVDLVDLRKLEYDITGLTQGDRIYIRAAAANNTGYSDFICSSPTSAVPSGQFKNPLIMTLLQLLLGLQKAFYTVSHDILISEL